MSNKTSALVSFGLVAVMFIAGVVLYARLPDPMPAHWNAAGEVDGHMSKFWGVFLTPIIAAALVPFFFAIPYIDPHNANIASFRGAFNWFIVGFTAYMLFVFGLILAAALGYQFNMTYAILPVVGLLFIGIGYMMRQAKRNFFIGIRTPWTLSSETVWDKTHQLGSKMFMLGGAAAIVGAFFGEGGIWLMLAAMLVAAFVPIVYSYILWKRENPRQDGKP